MVDKVRQNLVRQLAISSLKYCVQYKFAPIPENVLQAEMNKYAHLSTEELQKKISLSLSGTFSNKNKDGYELMGLNLTAKQKQVAKQRLNETSKKLHKFLDKSSVPKESYTKLSAPAKARHNEDVAISEQEAISNMSQEELGKYFAKKMWAANEKKDYSGIANAFFDYYGYKCAAMDRDFKINDFKDALTKYSGADKLAKMIKKAADDGNPNKLSFGEKAVGWADALGNISYQLSGTQGLTMASLLGEIQKAGSIGFAIDKGIKAFFALDGSQQIFSGKKGLNQVKTIEDVKNSASNVIMGTIMTAGGFELLKGGKGT